MKTKVEVYQRILAEMANEEPILKSAQVLKQEGEEMELAGERYC